MSMEMFWHWDNTSWYLVLTLLFLKSQWKSLKSIYRRIKWIVAEKVTDLTGCIYIPYEVKGESRFITIRKPQTPLQWAFVAGFVATMSGLIYAMHRATSKQRYVEAKKRIVVQYKKYFRLALFGVIFPIACDNSSDEIVLFVTHIGDYYRKTMGVVDLAFDAGSVVNDVFEAFASEDVEQEIKQVPIDSFRTFARSENNKEHYCFHHPDCSEKSTTEPCRTFCGGHHCRHAFDCSPHVDEKKYSPQAGEAVDFVRDDDDPDPLISDISDDEAKEYSTSDEDEPFSSSNPVTKNGDLDLEERRRESQRRYEELMKQQEEAIQRLQSGRSRQGLGFDPFHRAPSGVWSRLKLRVHVWYLAFLRNITVLVHKIRILCVKYQWWLIGGASLVAITAATVAIYKHLPSLRDPPQQSVQQRAEGGKKRKVQKKKDKADRKRARDATSTARDLDHDPSGKDGSDKALRFKSKEEEVREKQREEEIERWLDERYGAGRHDYESCSEAKFFKDMTRSELLSTIQLERARECPTLPEQQKRRRILSALFLQLNQRFPKNDKSKTEKPSGDKPPVKAPEHYQPGSLPFSTAKVYLVTGYLRGVGQVSSCFAYAGGLYVPRHTAATSDRIVVHHGGKEVVLPDKGVLVRGLPDLVMFPLPAGMAQNTGLRFRKPKTDEIATLFFVRQQSPTIVYQSVGKVGKSVRLGSDRALETFEFSATTEKGSCGGIYIAASDGYCIGYHGVGSDDVTVKPLFYPMEEGWYERAKEPAKQIPTYTPVEDITYQQKIDGVLNNKVTYESLNF